MAMSAIRPQQIRFCAARNALATCVGLALASILAHASTPAPTPPGNTTWTVENCNDDGPGSLRQTLSTAQDYDAVDLTQLTCSTITLTTGQLDVAVDNLNLNGNGETIDGNLLSRVLSHTGAGTLRISGLDFVNGSVYGGAGGCISSQGSVDLNDVTVRNCAAAASRGTLGGGLYAAGSIGVSYSTIADSRVILSGGSYFDSAHGGGLAAVGDISIVSSTISGNSVVANTIYSDGGGFWSGGGVTITNSTISGNRAYIGGAGRTAGAGPPTQSDIVDSTISGNTAEYRTAGILSFDGVLRIENSTIAFNSVSNGFGGVGVLTLGFQNVLYLGSSIIAENTTASGTPDDICWQGSSGGGVLGANNLIIASCNGIEPGDTIHADPLLASLADNGGPTMTHALLSGSSAIDHGNNASQLPTDQRGYARVSGSAADIGAVELQQAAPPDEIFRDGFD